MHRPFGGTQSSYCLYIVYLHKFFIANKHIIIYKYACNLQSVLPQCSTCDGDTNEALCCLQIGRRWWTCHTNYKDIIIKSNAHFTLLAYKYCTTQSGML